MNESGYKLKSTHKFLAQLQKEMCRVGAEEQAKIPTQHDEVAVYGWNAHERRTSTSPHAMHYGDQIILPKEFICCGSSPLATNH